MSITEEQFRKTIGLFPTGVTVVTTHFGHEDVGVTISSLTSVSLKPPQILFCLSKHSKTVSIFKNSAYFAVNILNTNQTYIADNFAENTFYKGEVADVLRHEITGCLLLSQALGYIICRKGDIYEGGDHHIILGEVLAVETNSEGLPLVRQKGCYLTVHPLPLKSNQRAFK